MTDTQNITFHEPPDGWHIGDLEEALWRARAAGGDDRTPVALTGEVRMEGIEIQWLPQRTEQPRWLAHAEAVGFWLGMLTLLAVITPFAVKILLSLWGWALG